MATDAEVLQAALDWLGPEGERWLKGKLCQFKGNQRGGTDFVVEPAKVCMEGSLRMALWGGMTLPAGSAEAVEERRRYDRLQQLLVDVAVIQFPDLLDEYGDPMDSVPEFNDEDRVGFGEVRVVFEKAIAEAAERGL